MRKTLALAGAIAAAIALGGPARTFAYSEYYDRQCTQCHGPTPTCNGCHAHGVHADAQRADAGPIGVSLSKATYAAGEDVVATVATGASCGWGRTVLLDERLATLATAGGPGGLGNGPDLCVAGPSQLRAPAPSTPGTYTWYAGWYGSSSDTAESSGVPTRFGALWRPGPGTGHGRELAPVTFTVIAGGTPAAALSPARLDFPRLAAGATRALEAQLRNTGAGVLQVTAIARCATGSSAFSWAPAAPLRVAPGAAVALSVTYQPLAAGDDVGCLELATNAPEQPVVRLDLAGGAAPAPSGAPAVTLSATALDFGSGVPAGSSVTRTFDVQSTGTANLDVSAIAPCAGGSDAFRYTAPLPGTVAPGEARTVTVYFTPAAAGVASGCLDVETSAGLARVALTGSAMMPPLTCTSCHGGALDATGAPPTDTAGNSDAASASVGAHAAHLATKLSPTVAQQAKDCTACHYGVKSFTDPRHRDGSIDVPFGGVATAGGETPSWDPATARCGAVYCHGAKLQGGTHTSPTWTKVGEGEAACGACHGVPPPPASGHPTVSGGLTACATCHGDTMLPDGTIDPAGKHIDGFPSGTTCTRCHGDPARPGAIAAAPPRAVDGATSTASRGVGAHLQHLQRGALGAPVACGECHDPSPAAHPSGVVEMRFGALATTGGATPIFDGVACSNVYCHGDAPALRGGTATRPVWTQVDGTQKSCTSCHGDPPPAPHPQVATCGSCHGAGYSATAVDPATHIDGMVEVTQDPTAFCTACHGDASRAIPAGADATVQAAPPVGSRGETATTSRAVGAHDAHLLRTRFRSTPIGCGECHAVPPRGDAAHVDGTATVTFGALARSEGATPAWDAATGTCSATYCHGNFAGARGGTNKAPVWTGTFSADRSTLDCGSCHGNPPGGTHPQNTACGACHGGATSTSYASWAHLDGMMTIVEQRCDMCHGDFSRVLVAGADPNAKYAPPLDTKGNAATTSRGVGVHQVHVNGTRSRPVGCAECHAGAVPPPWNFAHSDGVTTVAFGGVATTGGAFPFYGSPTLTCGSTYCHGNFSGGAGPAPTPAWTSAGTLSCTACHGNPPALPHPQDAACADCHGAGYSQTTVVAATHVDGVVTLGPTPPLPGGCTACHGDAARAVPASADPNAKAAPPIGTRGERATTTRAVGAHLAHLDQTTFRSTPIACNECHVVPPAYDKSHANGTATVTFGGLARAGGAAPAWNSTSLTCTSTYCHGSFPGSGGTNSAPSWTGSFTPGASSLGCTSCHGNPPGGAHPQNTACSQCHVGYGDRPAGGGVQTVNLAVHISGQTPPPPSCTACHGDANRVAVLGADANVRAAPPVDTKGNASPAIAGIGAHLVHVNGTRSRPVACAQCHAGAVPGPYDWSHSNGVVTVAFGPLAGAGAGGGAGPIYRIPEATCASTYCHGYFSGGAGPAATPAWTSAGTLSCIACHGNPPALPHPQDTACADCHGVGYSQTTVVAATHVDGLVTLPTPAHPANGCTACHGDATRAVVATADANARAAPPIGSRGQTATTAPAVGAHAAHLNQTTFRSTPIACNECHAVPPVGDKSHANGVAPVAFGSLAKTGGVPPTWNTTSLTCASTYCHGNFYGGNTLATPPWIGTFTPGSSSLTCTSCHGNPPTANGHPQRTDCGSCHPSGGTGTSYNLPTHINGVVNTLIIECWSCHGTIGRVGVPGADGLVALAPPVDTKGNTDPTARGVGAHLVHVNGTRSRPVACAECHPMPTTAVHDDGIVEMTFTRVATTGGVAPYFDRAAITCSSTYCHGNFRGGAGAAPTPPWTTAGTLACTACHGNPPPLPHPQGTACADCHGVGYSSASVVPLTHIDGVVTLAPAHAPGAAGGCAQCHGDATRAAVAGADPLVPAAPPAGSRGETPTTARAVGAHAAHVNQATFRTQPIACSECHVVPAAGDVTHANGVATVSFGLLARSGGATPAWNASTGRCASTYCHGAGGASAATPPAAAPTGLAFGSVTFASLTLSWTAVAGATAYKVERAPGSAAGPGAFVQIGTAAGTSYADAGLAGGTTYWYRVRATSDGGDGPYSPSAAQATGAVPPRTGTPVPTRYDLAAAPSTSVGADGSTNVTAQTTYSYDDPLTTFRARGVAGLALSSTQGRFRAGTALSASTTYSVVNLYTPALADANRAVGGGVPVSVDYYVRTGRARSTATIRAVLYEYDDATGNVGAAKGTYTSPTIDTSSATSTYRTLAGTISNGAFQVAAGHRLKVVFQVATGATGGNDVALLFGATRSGTRGQTFITPSLASVAAKTPAPSAFPDDLTFAAAPTALTLGWTGVAGATHYQLERAPDVGGSAGTFAQVGTTAATSYVDAGLAPATWYWYRVRAWNAGGSGPFSGVGTAMTAPPPPPGVAWTGTFTGGASTLTCSSCHGNPPTANGHPQRTDCGTCHPAATSTSYRAATHMSGALDLTP